MSFRSTLLIKIQTFLHFCLVTPESYRDVFCFYMPNVSRLIPHASFPYRICPMPDHLQFLFSLSPFLPLSISSLVPSAFCPLPHALSPQPLLLQRIYRPFAESPPNAKVIPVHRKRAGYRLYVQCLCRRQHMGHSDKHL